MARSDEEAVVVFPAMENRFRIAVAVAVGGALGAIARAGVASVLDSWGAASLWSVLTVNVLGALALGWYVSRADGISRRSFVTAGFVAVGFLGSFTTFSAFSLEVVLMFEDGAWLAASTYVFLSIGVALVALSAGRLFAERR